MAEILAIGISLFVLAIVYAFTEYSYVFDRQQYIGNYTNALKYALSYTFGYGNIMFKALVILLFIYIFVVIYNIALVAIFKPLISEHSYSISSIKFSTGADELVNKAKKTYFEAIKYIVKHMMDLAFGFLREPRIMFIMYIILPVTLFAVSTTLYFVYLRKTSKVEEMNTMYHVCMILLFSLVASSCMFAILFVFNNT
jgi:hypothetical protein